MYHVNYEVEESHVLSDVEQSHVFSDINSHMQSVM